MSKAYKEGWDAFFEVGSDYNPYDEGTKEFIDWLQGWYDSEWRFWGDQADM